MCGKMIEKSINKTLGTPKMKEGEVVKLKASLKERALDRQRQQTKITTATISKKSSTKENLAGLQKSLKQMQFGYKFWAGSAAFVAAVDYAFLGHVPIVLGFVPIAAGISAYEYWQSRQLKKKIEAKN